MRLKLHKHEFQNRCIIKICNDLIDCGNLILEYNFIIIVFALYSSGTVRELASMHTQMFLDRAKFKLYIQLVKIITFNQDVASALCNNIFEENYKKGLLGSIPKMEIKIYRQQAANKNRYCLSINTIVKLQLCN